MCARFIAILVIAFTAVAFTTTQNSSIAHTGADGKPLPKPFMERHAVMSSLGAHMAAIKASIRHNDTKAVGLHANAVRWLAMIVPNSFPKGSGSEMGKNRAADKIWQDWDGFVAASNVLASEAKKLAEMAKAGKSAELGKQFVIMGREGCSECHKVYRTPKR